MTSVDKKKLKQRFLEHDPYYRLGVGVMVLNDYNQVLVGKRLDMAGSDLESSWQMPQGGIDLEEEALQAAYREMAEEIGTDKVKLIAESKNWFSYDLPEELARRLWGGRFAGQKQKWFLFRFFGTDQDININTKHPEFCEWRWVDPAILPDIIVDFKRDIYLKVLAEFSPYF